MSVPITLTWANPAEGTCPTTIDEAIALYRTLLTGDISGTFTPYVIGSDTPAVEDQDKAWIRLDTVGRPLGTYVFYAGTWRREISGKLNEVTMFAGDPSLFFDGTGFGLITGQWDGWALCNGQNGTPNLTDKFIVAAHMDNSAGQTGYSAKWRTFVGGTITQTGGAKETTLALAQVPTLGDEAVLLDQFTADGNARNDSGTLLGHYSGTHDPNGSETIDPAITAVSSPTPVPTLPPYYALAYCIFIGLR